MDGRPRPRKFRENKIYDYYPLLIRDVNMLFHNYPKLKITNNKQLYKWLHSCKTYCINLDGYVFTDISKRTFRNIVISRINVGNLEAKYVNMILQNTSVACISLKGASIDKNVLKSIMLSKSLIGVNINGSCPIKNAMKNILKNRNIRQLSFLNTTICVNTESAISINIESYISSSFSLTDIIHTMSYCDDVDVKYISKSCSINRVILNMVNVTNKCFEYLSDNRSISEFWCDSGNTAIGDITKYFVPHKYITICDVWTDANDESDDVKFCELLKFKQCKKDIVIDSLISDIRKYLIEKLI
jgi:hypothetical protein